MTIDGQTCESSCVRALGYDDQSQTLFLKYPSANYRVSGVPQQVYDGLKSAESKGQYVNQHIRPFMERKQ